MSINTKSKKLNNNGNNNMNSTSSKQSDSKQYNVIINQNSTYNQDNSINIMVEGSFPYFQNYNNYQPNETESNKNLMYPVYLEQQFLKEEKDVKKSNSKDNNTEYSKEKLSTPKKEKKKKHNISPKNRKNNKENEKDNQNSTNKIDYRYIKKCPIKEMITPYKSIEKQKENQNQLFWFATYDKLMKTKYLLKIFNYYNNKPFASQRNINYNLKEKTLVIKDFEIYFYENSNKPFIRYAKGGTIYTKLYLLTLKQINQIFSYLNRIEYKIDYDRLNYLQRKGTFEIINDNANEVVLPYCLIYCLGKYMNINIYAFTNNIDFNIYLDENSFQKSQRISSYTVLNNNNNFRNRYILSNDKKNTRMDNTNINRENFKLPNSKKIAKLIKIINLNYPDYSIDDIINYLIPDNKYMNSITKINEIKSIFFFKKSNQNKIILSSMVRDTIKGISIQTPKSLLSSFCPAESILDKDSFKNSDLFQPASKKYTIQLKDDYKFQTINTNEKDNNNPNPFVIYVCDNVQKINFTNDNQNNMNNNVNNNQFIQYINPQQNNKNPDMNYNYIEDNTCLETDINQPVKKQNKMNQNINDCTNKKIHNSNKSDLFYNNKTANKKTLGKNKIKFNKVKIDVNYVSPGKQKGMKVQRISTDINIQKRKTKLDSDALAGLNKNKNKKRDSYGIYQSNYLLGNLNTTIKNLNKSIESHNNNYVQGGLAKNSDAIVKKKQLNNNKNKLINRINVNKKDNPFFENPKADK